MPIYEYECKKCGYEEEKFVKNFNTIISPKCIKCESKMFKKVSLSSFSLKGDGWYSPAKEKE